MNGKLKFDKKNEILDIIKKDFKSNYSSDDETSHNIKSNDFIN
jgi:hypothetical protein